MAVDTRIHEDPKLIETIRSLAREGFEGPGAPEFESRAKYGWLKELGSELWLDTGDASAAEKVWAPEMSALTTNNTLVNQVVQTGAMDGLVSYAAREIRSSCPEIPERDLVIEVGFVVNAKLALSLVQQFGAHVSVELHPDVGFDVHGTLVFARRYYAISPDHFYVKVPLTPDGLVAVKQLSSEGIPINFTLGFSARQNYLVALYAGPRYVNVFLGRLNQLVEENGLGEPENVGEKAALASQEAVRTLRESRAGVFTYQIAASMRSGRQVAALAGIDVLTIPPKAAAEYLEMDLPRSEIRQRSSEEMHVKLNMDRPVEAGALTRLWEIDSQFIAFAEDVVQQAELIASGQDLKQLSEKHGVDLFYDWTPEDRAAIREKGKIPDVSDWPGTPIDDLMSISALESFAKDQLALDQRMLDLIRQA